MKKFRLKADITFDAEDLDDAFVKLSDHFNHCYDTESEEFSALEFVGELKVETE